MHWISVTDRLPEVDQRVLVYVDGHVCFGVIEKKLKKGPCWWRDECCFLNIIDPSHWMPLPNAPIGE